MKNKDFYSLFQILEIQINNLVKDINNYKIYQ
jgi:hypothetical protein